MQNSNSNAGTAADSTTTAEVTTSSQTITKPNVMCSSFPLDPFIEVIRKRFPKFINAEETKQNIFRKKHSALFRKQHYNDYCFLEYTESCSCFSITIFKSDCKDFEKIEGEFLDFSFSFAVTLKDVETIMNCLV